MRWLLLLTISGCADEWVASNGETCRLEKLGPRPKDCDVVVCWTSSTPLRVVATTCRVTEYRDEGEETL